MRNDIANKLGGFAFWREMLLNEDSQFTAKSVHVKKCGYCGGTGNY